jgi:hypothetical protein
MDDRRILVIGAAELGLSLLRALSAHPAAPSVSVLLRPSSSPSRPALLDQLHQLKVTPVSGDITAPLPELTSLLQPFHTIICATGFASGPGTQLHLARAVLAAEVSWYFPWQFGVDYDAIGRGSSQPLFDEQLDVRDLLRGQNKTEWTVVSTGIFTSFLFDPAFGVVHMQTEAVRNANGKGQARTVKVTALGGWENSLTMTCVQDIASATARIACETFDKGIVYLAGDSVTFQHIADTFERQGWEVEQDMITVQELEKARAERPDDLGPKYGLIWARGVGVSWDKEGSYGDRHGMAFESMERWMGRNL